MFFNSKIKMTFDVDQQNIYVVNGIAATTINTVSRSRISIAIAIAISNLENF